MRKKILKSSIILLLIISQVFFASLKTTAASNSLTIECPEELEPNKIIVCSVKSDSSRNINQISGTFSSEKLIIKDFSGKKPWDISMSGNTFSATSTTEKTNVSEIGTLEITTTDSETTGTLVIDNLIFGTDQYSFSVSGPYLEIKILAKPVQPTCEDDEELVDGICKKKTPTCKEGEELVDGECKKKTPTCKEGETLIRNVCVVDNESKTNYLLIGVIVGIVVIIGVIIVIVILSKKKKTDKQSKPGTYLNMSGGGQRMQSGRNNQRLSQTPTQKYENGSYMSRSGKVTETTSTPPKNNDPKMQMKIGQSSTALQERNQLGQQPGQQNGQTITDPNDPRLQIQFTNAQQEMKLKNTASTQPTDSVYQVATQVTPEQPSTKPTEVIQKAQTPNQPSELTTNQYPTQPNSDQSFSQPSQRVELSKPTTPDIFES